MTTIETNSAWVSLIEDVVVVITVKEGHDIDLPEMWENYNASIELNPKGDYPVLFETIGFVNISKEARELAAGKEMAKNSCAMAIMIDNIALRIFGNFYIKVNKPQRPTKLFTDRNEAIQWLKRQYEIFLKNEKKQNLMSVF